MKSKEGKSASVRNPCSWVLFYKEALFVLSVCLPVIVKHIKSANPQHIVFLTIRGRCVIMIRKYTLSSSVYSSHTSSFNPYFQYDYLFRKGTQIMNIIFKRKSVRTYLDIDVDDASVEQIIRAGMAAPSARTNGPGSFMWCAIRKRWPNWQPALRIADRWPMRR